MVAGKLSSTDKLELILDAWQAFILIENQSNAKVPANEAKLEGVWLKQDTLSIDKDLFEEKKEEYERDLEDSKALPWMLSFPQIYQVRAKKTHYFPLFSLSIEPILAGPYQAEGWQIEKLPITESRDNLLRFSRELDEENIENLLTGEGLKRFLTSTFKRAPCKTFEGWMDQLRGPSWFFISRQPYLFRSRISGVFYNLEHELSEIRRTDSPHWRSPNHPAYSYIFGESAASRPKDTFYLGAFPTHQTPKSVQPPTNSQLEVLKQTQSGRLTAVKGPPGTGKTTIILHVIAQQVVNRAVAIIERKADASNLTLVSSKNNSAVDNVIERLNNFERPEEHESVPFLQLNGGNKDKTKTAIKQLSAAIEYLDKAEYSLAQQGETCDRILQIKTRIEREAEECDYIKAQQKRNKHIKATLPKQITQLRNDIKENLSHCEVLRSDIERLSGVANLPVVQYRQIKICFDQAATVLRQYHSRPRGWLKNLFGKSEQTVLREALEEDIGSILQTQAAPELAVSIPDDDASLSTQSQLVTQRLAAWEERYVACNELQDKLNHQNQLKRSLAEAQRLLSEANASNISESPDFYQTFHTRYRHEHIELFHLSREFLLQEALLRKATIRKSLKAYQDVISASARERQDSAELFARHLSEHLNALSLVFPVMTCTLLSIRNMLPFSAGCIDVAILDEAGTIPVHQAFPLLTKTARAIVVGDPLQLEPIVQVGHQTASAFKQEFFLDKGLSERDFRIFSPTQISTATAYHRAAIVDEYGVSQTEVQLKEHFRCQRSIISYCQKIARYDIDCITPPEKSMLSSEDKTQDGPNVVAYHVEGQVEGNLNIGEIEAVQSIFSHLVQKGYRVSDIGVVSPYRAQTDQLRRVLSKQFAISTQAAKDSIGTIHTFQGSEKAAIILSTKVCLKSDNLDWFNRKPNFLNVAVSRAKNLFVLVGNLSVLKEGEFTKNLIEHINLEGVVLEYKTANEVQIAKALSSSSTFYDCQHLGIWEDAIHSAQKELYIVATEITGQPNDKFVRDIELALQREVKVSIAIDGARRGMKDRLISRAEEKLRRLFKKVGDDRATLQVVGGLGTNRGMLVCDDKFVVVGSWNWLSEYNTNACLQGKLTAGVQIRSEASAKLTSPDECKKAIKQIKGSLNSSQ